MTDNGISPDIVERLREDFLRGEITLWNLLPEAAEEIDRLRAAFGVAISYSVEGLNPMRKHIDLDSLVEDITKVIQQDPSTNQVTKDSICNIIMLVGILMSDIHRIADGIEKISEEI